MNEAASEASGARPGDSPPSRAAFVFIFITVLLDMLALGIIHNLQHDDMEMAPVLAGLLMLIQAILALLHLVMSKTVTSPVSTPRA